MSGSVDILLFHALSFTQTGKGDSLSPLYREALRRRRPDGAGGLFFSRPILHETGLGYSCRGVDLRSAIICF